MGSLAKFYNSLSAEEKKLINEASNDVNFDILSTAANLQYNKHYNISLKLLNYGFELVTKKEEISQFHICYALNYEKLQDIEKCNYHCEEAVRLCHSGTYAYQRLIINYVKAKDWNNALRACDIVYKNEKVFDHRVFFEDKPSQWDDISSYATKRKDFILKQIQKEL